MDVITTLLTHSDRYPCDRPECCTLTADSSSALGWQCGLGADLRVPASFKLPVIVGANVPLHCELPHSGSRSATHTMGEARFK